MGLPTLRGYLVLDYICGPFVVIVLNWTHVFEWIWNVQGLEFKNGHRKIKCVAVRLDYVLKTYRPSEIQLVPQLLGGRIWSHKVCMHMWSFKVCGPHGVTLLSGHLYLSGLWYGNESYVCYGVIRLLARKFIDHPKFIQLLSQSRGPTWSLKVCGPYMASLFN